MDNFNPTKAEIIGLLCAEGSYYNSFSTYWQYYPNRGKYYLRKNKRTVYIQFSNYNNILLEHFKKLIKKEYNYYIKGEKDRIRICKRFIIEDLLKYTDYGHLKWKIPKEVIKGNKEVKASFIRGFFDGDGTVISSIRIFSNNKKSLKELSNLLYSLSIDNNFKGPYLKKNRKEFNYYIYIKSKDKDRFLSIIKPISKTL